MSEYLYVLPSASGHKIGITTDLKDRLRVFRNAIPGANFLHVIETDDSESLETAMHKIFDSRRVDGEWFSLTSEDIALIMSLGSKLNYFDFNQRKFSLDRDYSWASTLNIGSGIEIAYDRILKSTTGYIEHCRSLKSYEFGSYDYKRVVTDMNACIRTAWLVCKLLKSVYKEHNISVSYKEWEMIESVHQMRDQFKLLRQEVRKIKTT